MSELKLRPPKEEKAFLSRLCGLGMTARSKGNRKTSTIPIGVGTGVSCPYGREGRGHDGGERQEKPKNQSSR